MTKTNMGLNTNKYDLIMRLNLVEEYSKVSSRIILMDKAENRTHSVLIFF